jgi:predicted PurR-regulated permease PerM
VGGFVVNTQPELKLFLEKVVIVVSIGATLGLLVALRQYVTYMLIAVVLAAAMAPIIKAGLARKIPRPASVLGILLFALVALVLLGFAVVPVLIEQVNALAKNLPGQISSLTARFSYLPFASQITPNLSSLGGTVQAGLMQGVTIAVVAATSLGNAVLVLTLTILMALDAPNIVNGLLGFLPRAQADTLREQLPEMGQRLAQYVAGQAAISAILGGVCVVTLLLFKVPYALLLGVVLALFSIIPMVGGFIGMVPAVAVALFVSPLTALWVLGVLFLSIHMVGSFVAPLIFQHSVNIHPIVAITALVVGVTLGGLGGALVSVPVAAALQVLVVNLYLEPKRQRERLLGVEPFSAT